MNVSALVVSVALLAANAFFVAAEFALVAARRTRIEHMATEGNRRAKVALASIRQLSFMLAAAQLGITMASLGLGYVAEPAVAHGLESLIGMFIELPGPLLHSISFFIALTIVVFFHMVIGEMVPKNIAIAEPELSALWLAGPMRLYARVFGPLIRMLNALANGVLRLAGIETRDELVGVHSADEIAAMLAESRDAGIVDEFEHDLLSGALRFSRGSVTSAMVPRSRVRAVPVSATAAEVEALVVRTGHSRFPMYDGDLDQTVGFVHAKDLLDVAAEDRDSPLDASLLHRVARVSATTSLPAVFRLMRQERVHVAAVIDRMGRFSGIVTLEDVLEQLVGALADEHDRASRRQPRPA